MIILDNQLHFVSKIIYLNASFLICVLIILMLFLGSLKCFFFLVFLKNLAKNGLFLHFLVFFIHFKLLLLFKVHHLFLIALIYFKLFDLKIILLHHFHQYHHLQNRHIFLITLLKFLNPKIFYCCFNCLHYD